MHIVTVSQDLRPKFIRRAFLLEWLTIGWMSVEAIGSGIVAHSLTLAAFGIDSVIELASAGSFGGSPSK